MEISASDIDIKKGRIYAGGLTGFFLTYLSMPFLAPLLMYLGQSAPAQVIYTIYSYLCHQRAERSLFLFGKEPMYELSELNSIGIDTLTELRKFEGDHEHGYKLGFCSRCLGIHIGMVTSGIAFTINPVLAKPLKPKYVVLGILPMALDGVIQLVAEALYVTGINLWGSPPFTEPFYVSNNIRRLITGLIFGLTIGFWLYPSIIREFAQKKN